MLSEAKRLNADPTVPIARCFASLSMTGARLFLHARDAVSG